MSEITGTDEHRAGIGDVDPDASPVGESLRYLPALDGIRALAVLSVLCFHAGVSWLPAGFLGVDTFFVLSGFLITTLLLNELRDDARIALGAFWARRARRLLPALLVVVSFCALIVWFGSAKGTYPSFRSDAFSSIFYVANWHFIIDGTNYFLQSSAPSLLTHTWSLSIEEQFYVLWPLVMLGLYKLGVRSRGVLIFGAVGAALSAGWMALLASRGAAITRLYYGTDTHAQCLLVGAALAAGLSLLAQRRQRSGLRTSRADRHRGGDPRWAATTEAGRRRLSLLGIIALVVTALLWWRVSFQGWFLYHGGFLVAALATAGLIASVAIAQRGPVATLLSTAPLVFIGRISYGLYLWHFPLFQYLSPSRTGLSGASLLGLRFAAAFAAATASFFLIERPIRRRVLLHGWRTPVVTVGALLVTAGLVLGASRADGALVTPTNAIAKAHTSTAGAMRVLFVGDSVSIWLNVALASSPLLTHYDVQTSSVGLIGCGVYLSQDITFQGQASASPTACNEASPSSEQLHALWAHAVATYDPQVVVILAGRWEVDDVTVDGRSTSILDPSFQARVKAGLESAVSIASARGAQVVLLTAPCYSSGTQPNGQPWPEDSAQRLAAYNRLMREVAAAHPSTVSLVDLNAMVCPGGQYHASLDGIAVRSPDGIHFLGTSGPFLGPRLWPAIVAAGHRAHVAPAGGS